MKEGARLSMRVSPEGLQGKIKEANQMLKNAIQFLQEGKNSQNHWLWNQRLAIALIYKKELKQTGFTWQAKRIDNWIHRLKPKRGKNK